MNKITLNEIKDLREYERIRSEYKADVIQLKKKRRVFVGDFISLVFENKKTVEYQIHEMARIEKLISDEQIQNEIDAYNDLIPNENQLSATLFIELNSKEELENWLPKLPGIQNNMYIQFNNGQKIYSFEEDEERLTREEEITSTVHYIKFNFSDEQKTIFLNSSEAIIGCDHKHYNSNTTLSNDTVTQLQADLKGK